MVLYGFGSNSYGQLGVGNVDDQHSPAIVPLSNPLLISCGSNHSIALLADNSIWGCGLNTNGQLGLSKNHEHVSVFTKSLQLLPNEIVKSIACGWDFTIVLHKDSSLWVTGSNLKGCLAIPGFTCTSLYSFKLIAPFTETLIKIVAGVYHVLAITENGKVLGWGENKKNKLGSKPGILFQPSEIIFSEPYFIDVAAGLHTTIALGASGSVYINSTIDTFSCIYKLDVKDLAVSVFSLWHSHFILIKTTLIGWGRNNFGQISRNFPQGIDAPQEIVDLPFSSLLVKKFTVGSEHAIILTYDGDIWTWGWNEHGNCGYYPSLSQDKIKIVSKQGKNIFCGYAHSFYIT